MDDEPALDRKEEPVKKLLLMATLALAVVAMALPAWAGSPHFVGTPTYTISGNTVTVSAKEAGLGDEDQINVTLSGTAECINGGSKHPSASNKTGFATSITAPVQNGQATYTVTGTATFSPACSPPMTLVFTSLVLTDTTNSLTVTLI
jgi:hypothetical protein